MQTTRPYQVKRVPAILRRGSMRMMQDSDFAFGHKIKAFQRFEFFPEMLLFSELKNQSEVSIADALRHFVHRFPTFVIAFYQWPFLWTASSRMDARFFLSREFASREKALEWLRKECREKIRERLDFSVEWSEKFYGTFFDSQFIEQRRNPALQKRLMPLFFLDKESPEYRSVQKHRRAVPNTTLGQFV
ncbi:MAG: DUF4130 domain-containing protein [Candidatus Diapherotrites archaeon]|nr:DUF4130 domain-containing protein [Candidatus Diapherotrites archaeon]